GPRGLEASGVTGVAEGAPELRPHVVEVFGLEAQGLRLPERLGAELEAEGLRLDVVARLAGGRARGSGPTLLQAGGELLELLQIPGGQRPAGAPVQFPAAPCFARPAGI